MSGVGWMCGFFWCCASNSGFLPRIGQRHVHDVDRQQLGLAGVEAALEHLQIGDRLRGHTQRLRGQLRQGLGGVGRRLPVLVGFGRGVGGCGGARRAPAPGAV
jgi:hypothetical protein